MVAPARSENRVQPRTVEEAVALLVGRLSDDDRSLVRSLPEDELTERLHFTLGQTIRNDFGLWSGNTDLLRSCGSEKMPDRLFDGPAKSAIACRPILSEIHCGLFFTIWTALL